MSHSQRGCGRAFDEGRKSSLTGVLTGGMSVSTVEFPSSGPSRTSQGSSDKMIAMTGTPAAAEENADLQRRKLSRQTSISSMMVSTRSREVHDKRDLGMIPTTYEETVEQDKERLAVLRFSRETDVQWSCFKGSTYLIRRTIIPRLIRSPSLWLAFGCFALGATLARLDVLGLEEGDSGTNQTTAASVLITFMLTFYLGYCYSRYYAMYFLCVEAGDKVAEIAMLACMYIDKKSAWLVWRYCNQALVAAFVGLSPVYGVDNLFRKFVEAEGLVRDRAELRSLVLLDLENSGMRAHQEVLAWALAIVSDCRRRGGDSYVKPEGGALITKIVEMRDRLASLFHFQFQVRYRQLTHW